MKIESFNSVSLRRVFRLFAALLIATVLQSLFASIPVRAQTGINSLAMPIPLDHLQPITVENTNQITELGWFRHYDKSKPTNAVSAIAFSPDGTKLASGGIDDNVQIWDVATGTELGLLHVGYYLRALAFSPDGKLLATAVGTEHGTIQVWEVSSLQQLWSSPQNTFGWALAFSNDSSILYSIMDGLDNIFVLNSRTGELIQRIPFIQGYYNASIAINPKTGAMTAYSYNIVRTWAVPKYDELYTVHDAGGYVTYSPDGSRFAVGIYDAKTSIVDAQTGKILAQTTTYSDTSFVFGADSRLLIIANDSELWLWDTQSDKEAPSINSKTYPDLISTNARSTILASVRSYGYSSDIVLYGVPDCAVRAKQAVRLHQDSNTTSAVTGGLEPQQLGYVKGKRVDSAGTLWWQLTNSAWVRSNLVETVGKCDAVPES